MTDLPAPFIERTRRLLGDDYPRFAESLELESPTSIRLNPSKSTPTGTIGDPVLWARHGFLSLFPANVYLRPPASRRSLLRTRSGIDVPQSGNTAIRS